MLKRDLRGVRVGPYEIVRLLGQGATSSVFEARHTVLGRPVAIKILHEHLARDERTVARFVREGRIAAQLRHPHVVDVVDVGEQEGTPFLVMELLDGVDLGTWLRARGPLPAPEALDTLLPLASALAAAHAAGALHRDLKPANVMLARDGRGLQTAKLVDFGLSKQRGGDSEIQLTQAAAVLGTLGYIAPEQLLDAAKVDERSDQYGLGAILYECLTGRPPYVGATIVALIAEVQAGPPAAPSTLVPGVPAGLEDALMVALAFEPPRRHADVRTFARALLPFASEAARAQWTRDFEGERAPSARPDRSAIANAPTVQDRVSPPAEARDPGPVDLRDQDTRSDTAPPKHAGVSQLPVRAGTSPFLIKGLGYRGLRVLIARKVAGGLEGFCALLGDPHLATFIRQTFLATGQYDVLPMLPLSETLADLFSTPFEQFVRDGNAAQARHDATGVYRALQSSSTEQDFASRIPRWINRHYEFGENELLESRPGRIVLRRGGQPQFLYPWYAPAQAGYLTAIAEMSGLEAPTVTFGTPKPDGRQGRIVTCSFETEVRWQPRG